MTRPINNPDGFFPMEVGMVIGWHTTATIPAGFAICNGATVNGVVTPNLGNRVPFDDGGTARRLLDSGLSKTGLILNTNDVVQHKHDITGSLSGVSNLFDGYHTHETNNIKLSKDFKQGTTEKGVYANSVSGIRGLTDLNDHDSKRNITSNEIRGLTSRHTHNARINATMGSETHSHDVVSNNNNNSSAFRFRAQRDYVCYLCFVGYS